MPRRRVPNQELPDPPAPRTEQAREGAFSYPGEDKKKDGYSREARYAGRDRDSEERYVPPEKRR